MANPNRLSNVISIYGLSDNALKTIWLVILFLRNILNKHCIYLIMEINIVYSSLDNLDNCSNYGIYLLLFYLLNVPNKILLTSKTAKNPSPTHPTPRAILPSKPQLHLHQNHPILIITPIITPHPTQKQPNIIFIHTY
jgi:hypothetical protein